jgi:hypothetical protein
MSPTKTTIDPALPGKLVLAGRIVTMNAGNDVIEGGRLYIKDGSIAAVLPAKAPAPPDFAGLTPVQTRGTIFPGLIELHNHLPYNVLQLWRVPKLFGNRDQWGRAKEYGALITTPMRILGSSSELMPAVVRYVEVKAMLGGTTSSQGIALFSNTGSRRYYRGLVRNVENTADPDLPDAVTRIADVDASDASSFVARLKKTQCFLLHLSEGTNPAARQHFEALHLGNGDWAIERSLCGIHCVALQRPDFDVLASKQASMVWSPFSNLLLYGKTADIAAAAASGVKIGLGSDWAPSGSKNLLGELKVAFIEAQRQGLDWSARDIVRLATRNAADILNWGNLLGSLEAGKKADLFTIDASTGDPYEALLKSHEAAIQLIMINGIPRLGTAGMMKQMEVPGESLRVGRTARILNLAQQTADPDVGKQTLGNARASLDAALRNLPQLAQDVQKKAMRSSSVSRAAQAHEPREWFLALDELEDTGTTMRPRLPLRGVPTGPSLPVLRAKSTIELTPKMLDPLTVLDDIDFLDRVAAQTILPTGIASQLRRLYE